MTMTMNKSTTATRMARIRAARPPPRFAGAEAGATIPPTPMTAYPKRGELAIDERRAVPPVATSDAAVAEVAEVAARARSGADGEKPSIVNRPDRGGPSPASWAIRDSRPPIAADRDPPPMARMGVSPEARLPT